MKYRILRKMSARLLMGMLILSSSVSAYEDDVLLTEESAAEETISQIETSSAFEEMITEAEGDLRVEEVITETEEKYDIVETITETEVSLSFDETITETEEHYSAEEMNTEPEEMTCFEGDSPVVYMEGDHSENLLQIVYENEVNPLYADLISAGDLSPVSAESDCFSGGVPQGETIYTDAAAAGVMIRSGMVQRNSSIVFYSNGSFSIKEAINQALIHTGNGKEGDYLRFQYGGWTSKTVCYSGGERKITLTFTYYTTADQEAQVDSYLISVYQANGFQAESSTYRKVCMIQSYILEHVSYETANPDNKYRFSAYGALLQGRAVCQGYSILAYRMALDLGIDIRILISSEISHAWNLVRMADGYYYHMDTTYDDGNTWNKYFLKCDSTYAVHHPGAYLYQEDYRSLYPLGSTD